MNEIKSGIDASRNERRLGPATFLLAAFVIGVVAAVGAWIFRGIIALFHNAFFLGKFTFYYDAAIHTPAAPWGAGVVLVPVMGALGVTFLVQHFAPEAKGHGVPEVMDAIFYKRGVIRPVVALIKSLASALSIGSGASVGREGPIVQIGSAFGSTFAQMLRLPAWQTITMIAAGAGGGIAATFNTPVGGVLFAMELLLHEVSVRTVVPVTIATVTAAYFGQLFFGAHPAFMIPAFQQPYFAVTNPEVLLGYIGLGAVTGVASALYISSIYAAEDFFEKIIPTNGYLRHAAGMLLLGAVMYLLFRAAGHYHIEGVGYATIQDVLTGAQQEGGFLILLFVLKLLATSLSLGSGASGGVFSPALFLGATLGAPYGLLLHKAFPGLDVSPPAFAVAGMAGVVGGSTGATVTAIVMILEMTYDYSVVIPVTLTVATSYGIRSFLSRYSIYTLKLARRGHYIPEAMHSDVQELARADTLMDMNFVVLAADTPIDQFREVVMEQSTARWFVFEGRSGIEAVVPRLGAVSALAADRSGSSAGELLRRRFTVVGKDASLVEVIAGMRRDSTAVVVVAREGTEITSGVAGIIGKEAIVDAMADALDVFSRQG